MATLPAVARTQFGAVGGWRFLLLVAVVVFAWLVSWWILLVLPGMLLVGALIALIGRSVTRSNLASILPDPVVRSMVLGVTADQLVAMGQSRQKALAMAEAFLVERPELARERAVVAYQTLDRMGQGDQPPSGSNPGPLTTDAPSVEQARPARRVQGKRRHAR